jgi:hypothetical protein
MIQNHRAMKRLIKVTVIFILVINSFGALWGGAGLVYDPDGGYMQMPLSFLEHSPFSNYLIPGIILFTVNGLFGLLTLYMTLRRHPLYTRFLFLQGVLLAGWISVQVAMLQIFFAPLHLPFFLMGIFLMIAAGLLKKGYLLKPKLKTA